MPSALMYTNTILVVVLHEYTDTDEKLGLFILFCYCCDDNINTETKHLFYKFKVNKM